MIIIIQLLIQRAFTAETYKKISYFKKEFYRVI